MKRIAILIALLSLALLMFNCEDENNPSIWDKNDAGETTPVISSVDPATQQYGGVGTRKLVTITGSNFNSDKDQNFVYFGKELGTIVEGSATELKVAAPANYADDLKLEVHSQGAYLPAIYGGADNPTEYSLIAAERRIAGYDAYNKPEGICVDKENNLYVTSAKQVDKIAPDGTVTEGAYELKAKFTGDILVGPDEAFYYLWTKYIFKTDFQGNHLYKNAKFNINAMDFDENLNMYIVGDEQIAHVNYTDLTITTLQEFEDISFKGCKVYNSDLYLVAQYTGSEEGKSTVPYLCKVGLNSDGTLAGDLQVIQDFTGSEYESMKVTQLVISENGNIFIATDMSLLALEDGALVPVYPEVLGEFAIYNVAWGTGEEIFVNTNNITDDAKISLMGIMLFEESAPYYGRN